LRPRVRRGLTFRATAVEQGSNMGQVRQALAELGEVSDANLLGFLGRKHGVRIEAARAAAEKVVAEQASQKRPRRGATSLPGGSGV
jgi:hypothetical protein